MSHICMIVHQYYHRDPRVRRYAEALVDARVRVDVLCLHDKSEPVVTPQDGIRLFPIPLRRLYKNSGSYLIEYGVSLVLFTVRLLSLYLKNRYAIIHIHNMPDFLVFTAVIPRMLGAKLILDIHDPMPEFYMSKFGAGRRGLIPQLLRVQEKLSVGFAHKVITANSNFKNNLIGRGIHASKIVVVNNVADPHVFRRQPCQNTRGREQAHFTLVYPGTIAPRYGLDVPIRALPICARSIPSLRLILMGPRVSFLSELMHLAETLNVAHLLQYQPAVSVDQVPALLRQADVGIYPALPSPHMDIAMPCKVLEYMAMGVPVVASRLKVLADAFPESALLLFEPGNVEEFAEAVLQLYNNPARREELVRNADRAYANAYSWCGERQKYFGVLRQLAPRFANFHEH